MTTKAKKPPSETPDRGERSRLRSDKTSTGTLRKYDPESEWATVEWDAGVAAPKTVHRFELVRISA